MNQIEQNPEAATAGSDEFFRDNTAIFGLEREQQTSAVPASEAIICRDRIYQFVLDDSGEPIELGSGRFAKAYLGTEHWAQSKTGFCRKVAIKVLQRGVTPEVQLRFQLEKQILERVQGHPNIIELLTSGEGDNPSFIPQPLAERVENDFLVLELLDVSLEERLKGSRASRRRDDLLSVPPAERVLRVLEYMVPVATAIEYAHLACNTSHRDIKPANILLKLPNAELAGSQLQVKLADFNVGKVVDSEADFSMTRFQSVPGTLYFQSPEQETNSFELLVNATKGSNEVDYFEDFYMEIAKNDTFQIFNRDEVYEISSVDRNRKKLLLTTPFLERSEQNVRAKVVKCVDRPADIYSLGALFYYLVTGAYGNPKTLYDSFKKFIEYEKRDKNNNIDAYLEHEYRLIKSIRAPKQDEEGLSLAPEDQFFSYKHYLDGNGELIDADIMRIIARAMIRNKPDSYCQAWDTSTVGISALVGDLLGLYARCGASPVARGAYFREDHLLALKSHPLRRAWDKVLRRGRGLRR